MDWVVRAFLKASLLWFAAGVTVGLAMAVDPTLTVYRTAHLHLNLLGFVTQMIYGVSLHVVPRFFGHPLVHPRLADVQFWLAQSGLVLLIAGFVMRVSGRAPAQALLIGGAVLSAAAAMTYILNLWKTMSASSLKPLARGRPVPLAHQPQAD